MNVQRYLNTCLVFMLLIMAAGTPMPAAAQGQDPNFHVYRDGNSIRLIDWPMDATLVITFDDPDTGPGIDYQLPDITVTASDFEIYFGDDYNVDVDHMVTVSDGQTTTTHKVTKLSIISVNLNTHIISGIADENMPVWVHYISDQPLSQQVDPLPGGNWEADLSSVGLEPGGWIQANQFDNFGFGNSTIIDYWILNPVIGVRANQNQIEGWDWPEGATITITVDDPDTPEVPDMTMTTEVFQAPWDPDAYRFEIDLQGVIDIQPGFIITATDGTTTKTHVVLTLLFTDVNLEQDTVSGFADPGQSVSVWTCFDDPCVHRETTADENGDWTVNFAIPGPQDWEWETTEIRAGSWIDSSVMDEDGDSTMFGHSVPIPNIVVFTEPNQQSVSGNDWPEGATITVTIDDPASPESPDLTLTAEVYQAPWNPDEYRFDIDLQGVIDIKPGFIVTATDGTTTKTHVVSTLSFTDVNVEQDTVSGITDPHETVQVWTCFENSCANRETTADENGEWKVYFAIPGPQDWEWETADIRAGSWIDSSVTDDDGDRTMFWYRFDLRITVSLHRNAVIDNGWPENTTLTLSIDDPTNGPGEDYSAQIIANQGETFEHAYYGFALYEMFQIQPGHIVTVSGGGFSVTHVVKDLHITEIDYENDIVSGICTPGSEVRVSVHIMGQRWTSVDEGGNWHIDFSNPEQGFTHNITPATEMPLHCYDVSSQPGETENIYPVNFTVSVHGGAWGNNWTIGQPVFLEIDDPATPQSPDFTDTAWPEPGPWYYTGVNFPVFPAFDIQPGFIVTATQGNRVQTHTVTNIAINEVNVDEDTVSGISNPNAYVLVGVDSGDHGLRWVQADSEGNWFADYKVMGEFPPWQGTAELFEGVNVWAGEYDSQGNSTGVNWDWFDYAALYIEQYTFNFNNPLLADVNIRQAIALGTDRQRILDQAFLPGGEYGQLVNSPVPPGNPYLAPAAELTLYSYNPLEASALLENAGWVDTNGDGIRDKDGQKLSFIFRTTLNPMRTMAAQIFRENMLAIGIDITVIQDPDFDNIVSGNFDIAEFALGPPLENHFYFFFNLFYSSSGLNNFGSYSSSNFDAALEAFNNSETEDEMLEASILAQQIFTADLPAFYLFTRENLVPHQTPTGTSVTLTPLPQVTITYTNVDQEGVTAALAVSFNPADLPENMELVGSAYEIGTTAMFETVQVCLSYSDYGLSPEQESALRLYHYHNGVWLDVTDPGSPDTVNNIVCGTATDFSMFAVLLPLNQPPQIESITAPIDPVQIGQTITATVVFSDPNINDTHTATWDWGDGSITTVPAVQPTVSTDHVYDTPGVYTITVTITDSADESDSATHQYVVIYDPDGGFVTGGGWILSPEGAYIPEPELTGRATFAFVSKYKKGANTPTGNTAFQFHVADMNFRSDSYDWLVVAGSKAIYKGSGTINGEGDYGFMLSAIDGSPDRFRIKIWVKATDEVIYDNMLGMPDNTDPTTAVQGGSIIIHNTK